MQCVEFSRKVSSSKHSCLPLHPSQVKRIDSVAGCSGEAKIVIFILDTDRKVSWRGVSEAALDAVPLDSKRWCPLPEPEPPNYSAVRTFISTTIPLRANTRMTYL